MNVIENWPGSNNYKTEAKMKSNYVKSTKSDFSKYCFCEEIDSSKHHLYYCKDSVLFLAET